MSPEVRNHHTPRIFVAATRQDDGKTTTSLGLFAALQKRFSRIGYIKPVGQRFVEVEGVKVDEDTVLMNDTYGVRTPLRAMSPIAVEPDFTRRFLKNRNVADLHQRVREAFDEAAWEKDFVIIEGTGHAGVGSVFELSNAQVAKLLGAQVVIVSQGGIGRPIDEIAMNLALFEKFGVKVIGAIINKIVPEKADLIPYVREGLERMGLPLLGTIPLHQELRSPTLEQICHQLKGEFLAGADHRRRPVGKVVIGAMSSYQVEKYLGEQSLLITSGDREDMILTAAQIYRSEKRGLLAGVVLVDGILPSSGVLRFLCQADLPYIACACDSYTAASQINRMTVKTESADREKISLIQRLVEENVDVDRLISAGQENLGA
ncbi:MAG: AAA family ATPase [Verrucomicrobium sp.]|nr:AAA family ATPase [Verrucomicrobium sp.]